MRRTAPLSRALLVVTAWMAVGCGESPAAPDDVSAVSALEIAGLDTLAPGQTLQFRALAHLSGGSTRDVTAVTTWSSTAAGIVSLSTTGLATGRQNGEAVITANYQGRTDSLEVIVVPPGTYRLTGSVVDPLFPNERLAGDTVSAVGADGVSHTTPLAAGRFRFYGLVGRVRIQVSNSVRFWLDPLDVLLDVAGHRSVTLEMPLKDPGRDVSGRYVMRIAADPACRDSLPAHGMVRSYTAEVSQRGALVQVRLGGATFAQSTGMVHNFLDGRLESSRLSLYLYEWTDSTPPYPGLYEVLSPESFYGAGGTSELEDTPGGFAGRLTGTIVVAGGDTAGTCRAAGHTLTLSRQDGGMSVR